MHGSQRPDTFVDVADTLDLKIRALREHRSQLGPWDPAPFVTGWAREQGKTRRLPAAEAFRRMVLGDL
jgi:LmbE family N-acetylglucosaminyl deacetylase